MEDTQTRRAVQRAAKACERATDSLFAAMLAAAESGMTYEQLAELTGWDRRTVSRKLASIASEYGYAVRQVRNGQVDYVLVERSGGGTALLEVKGGETRDDA